jgi:HD-GYP domain-containing protein (c-di-GMP phosphodiesterase class II)
LVPRRLNARAAEPTIYRPALRPITALRELQRRSGTQFDPEAVTALTATARVSGN